MSEILPIQKIVLTRAEGPIGQCDKPVTVTSWLEAQAALRAWSDTAPEKGGYDKVDFTIWWVDMPAYHGRYDLVHWRCERPDLAEHVRTTTYFYTGRRTPSHMTVEQHRQLLCREDHHFLELASKYEHLIAYVDLDVDDHPAPQFGLSAIVAERRDRRIGSW